MILNSAVGMGKLLPLRPLANPIRASSTEQLREELSHLHSEAENTRAKGLFMPLPAILPQLLSIILAKLDANFILIALDFFFVSLCLSFELENGNEVTAATCIVKILGSMKIDLLALWLQHLQNYCYLCLNGLILE